MPTRGFLGRLGGDELALLTVAGGDGDKHPARAVAEKVIAALREPFVVSGRSVDVQASIGIATATGGAPGVPELLRNADITMYAATNEHKGGWRFFEPAMLTAVVRRHRLRAALADAVARGEFAVFYQPIVDRLDGSVHGIAGVARLAAGKRTASRTLLGILMGSFRSLRTLGGGLEITQSTTLPAICADGIVSFQSLTVYLFRDRGTFTRGLGVQPPRVRRVDLRRLLQLAFSLRGEPVA